MKKEELIQKTAEFIRQHFEQEGSGHDWWHIFRVWQLSKVIASSEKADMFLVEMAALLHDLDDWKLSSPTSSKAADWMKKTGMNENEQETILQIIEEVSFKGAGVETQPQSVEAAIVQDADRLDAIGAIGIARTFAYGGHKNRLIYDPAVKPEMHEKFSDYQKSTAPTINHFYEKLLLLKDRMNTKKGREIAARRHKFLEIYLEHFYQEWNIEE